MLVTNGISVFFNRFDEARYMRHKKNLSKNNIGSNGIPKDPKFVSFN